MSGEVVRLIHGRERVVVAFRLAEPALARLRTVVGPDTRLVDLRDSDGHEGLVLAPPASPQLLGRLRNAFPDARIMVVELTDPEAGIRQGGPVTRAMDAGADAYVMARSLDQLAELVDRAVVAGPVDIPVTAALKAGVDDDLATLLEEALARRQQARAGRSEEGPANRR